MHTTFTGLDVAKNVFQLHAEEASGEAALEEAAAARGALSEPFLRKLAPALIGMEATARRITGAA